MPPDGGGRLIKLRFPSAVPSMIPALKLGATLSVVGVIVSEISAGQRGGIGRAVISYSAGSTGDPTKPYAAVAGAAAIGLLLYGVIVLLDVMLMHNRPQEDELVRTEIGVSAVVVYGRVEGVQRRANRTRSMRSSTSTSPSSWASSCR